MSDKKNIETWFNDVVLLFRKEYQKLSEEEKKRVNNLWDFRQPCQIEIIQFVEPIYQIIIITHFEDEDDFKIIVHEPIEMYNAINHLEEVLQEPRWEKEQNLKDKVKEMLSDRNCPIPTYKNALEGFFILNAIPSIKNSVFVKPRGLPDKGHGLSIGIGESIWLIHGNITCDDISEFIDGIIKEAKNCVNVPKHKEISKTEDSGFTGYGSYLYPLTWIDRIPELKFRDLVGNIGYQLDDLEKSFDIKYKEKQIVVYNSGLIVVVTEDTIEAKRILNELMAISILNDFPVEAIRDNELYEVEISDNLEITGLSHSGEPTARNLEIKSWYILYTYINHMYNPQPFRVISSDKLKNIIQQAEKIKSSLDNSLIFLLEAYTHLRHSEYPQSFLMSWLIIEEYLSEQWDKFLETSMTSTGKKKAERKGKFKSDYWSTDRTIEILNLMEKNDKQYNDLMDLKSKRNKGIAHGKKVEIKKDDADKCFNVAFLFLKEKIEAAK